MNRQRPSVSPLIREKTRRPLLAVAGEPIASRIRSVYLRPLKSSTKSAASAPFCLSRVPDRGQDAGERLLRAPVEDRSEVLAEQDPEVRILLQRPDDHPTQGKIGLERQERDVRHLVEDPREVVELLDDERQLPLGRALPAGPLAGHGRDG
jgi:hypothetical protein